MNKINLENAIISITNSFIENKEIEIRKAESVQKLILWLGGLSIGFQSFLFNLISYSKTEGFITVLFIISLICFIYISISVLSIKRIIHLINNIENSNIQKLNNQKLLLINKSSTDTNYFSELIESYESGELIVKIGSGDYLKKENEKLNSAIKYIKQLNGKAEGYISTLLFVQFVAIAVLLFLK